MTSLQSPPPLPSSELSTNIINTGVAVDARQYVAEGTALHATLALVGLVLILLITVLITYGIAIIFWAIGGVVYIFKMKKARAALRGSALRVGSDQFPDIARSVAALSGRLGMPTPPEVYIVAAAQPNALAAKLGHRLYVVLHDDIIHGTQQIENPRVLDFILAHELAHHALGHTGLVRRSMAAASKSLSRRDEFSCDAVANALLGDLDAARDALSLLMVGPHLFKQISPAGLERQLQEVLEDPNSRRAERSMRMTHPLILRRIARLYGKIKI